jgi:hypothetical protein
MGVLDGTEHAPPLGALDLAGLIAVLALAIGVVMIGVQQSPLPAEDAAILLRYAQHLADGHGIVWNLGGPPTEGATDFVFLCLVAAAVKLGLSAMTAAAAVGGAAHALTAAAVYLVVRRLHGAPPSWAFLSGAALALGPGVVYVDTRFGTPLFALVACAAWTLAHRASMPQASRGDALSFAVAALALGLARPDGLVLAVLMLAAIVWYRGARASATVTVAFAAVVGVLGTMYFIWRWRYFGHVLPLPLLKKGGWQLHWESLAPSLATSIKMTLPLLLVLFWGLRDAGTRRRAIFALIPLLGYASAWVLVDENNFAGRFQYVLLPLLLIAWPAFLPQRRREPERLGPRAAVWLALALVAIWRYWSITLGHLHPGFVWGNSGLSEVGTVLHKYSQKGYLLAVSEAGMLPFYSGWRAVDMWGLNDAHVTVDLHGRIDRAYLEQLRPDVIEYDSAPNDPPDWMRMVRTARQYAIDHSYMLAGDFRRGVWHTQSYWVRSDCPDSAAIVDDVRKLRYEDRFNLALTPALREETAPADASK